MGGLAGFLDAVPHRDAETLRQLALRMADLLESREPNERGIWTDSAAGVALGTRQVLADPAAGPPPLLSASGRYVLAFDGTIYNHAALRGELLTYPDLELHGPSDTELLLAAVELYGLDETLQQLAGMFAFALWDQKERVLYLCRDRLGEKPLYYGWLGRTLLFGSQLSALRCHPQFTGLLHRDALRPYLRHGYIPAPYSIYADIYKLPPGHVLRSRPGDWNRRSPPVPFWSVRLAAEMGQAHRLTGSVRDLIEPLEQVLREVIGEQMPAAEPPGAWLSGGVASSTLVALLQTQTDRPVKTFTLGFMESASPGLEQAREIAEHLGTDHTEWIVTAEEALQTMPRLPALHEEPLADPAQIPLQLLARQMRPAATVSLSGIGGAAVFAGRDGYRRTLHLWQQVRYLPADVRKRLADWLQRLARGGKAPGLWALLLPRRWRSLLSAERLAELGQALQHAGRVEQLHEWLLAAHWPTEQALLPGTREPATPLTDAGSWVRLPHVLSQLQCFDLQTQVPDDLLVLLDRVCLSAGLEPRSPFLDARVVELALRLPPPLQMYNDQPHWLLRQLLQRYVPRTLLERPQQKIRVPLDSWLRGPLRDWAEELLSVHKLRDQGYFDAGWIRRLWDEHQAGLRNWQRQLWPVLMFQAWSAQQTDRGAVQTFYNHESEGSNESRYCRW